MFDWKFMLILTAVCVPGIAVVVPRTLGAMGERLETSRTAGKKVPPRGVLEARRPTTLWSPGLSVQDRRTATYDG